MKRSFRHAGFTIVELLIVIVVIAILAAITVIAYNGVTARARASTAQTSASQATGKVLAYAVDHADEYPSDLAVLGIVDNETIKYEYTVDNGASPRTFCVTVRVGTTSYYQNNTTATHPTEGECPAAPVACATGFIAVPGDSRFGTSDFCVMKYEAKNVGGTATSQAAGQPWVNRTIFDATDDTSNACAGCHLVTEPEWMTIAANVLSVASNWSGGAVGNGSIYRGNSDTSSNNGEAASTDDADGYYLTYNSAPSTQRRTLTLTNGEVIWDFAGNVAEWTNLASINYTQKQPGVLSQPNLGTMEWNNGNIALNGLPASSTPGAISAAVAGYSSAQGIGMLSSYPDNTLFAVTRGGFWTVGVQAGVLSLQAASMSSGNAGVGFRAAK